MCPRICPCGDVSSSSSTSLCAGCGAAVRRRSLRGPEQEVSVKIILQVFCVPKVRKGTYPTLWIAWNIMSLNGLFDANVYNDGRVMRSSTEWGRFVVPMQRVLTEAE